MMEISVGDGLPIIYNTIVRRRFNRLSVQFQIRPWILAVKSKVKRGKPGTVRDRFRKLRRFHDAGLAMLNESAGLGPCALWTLLWGFEDAESQTVNIGRRSLAKYLGCDERTVRRQLTVLKDLGYLEVVRAGIKGRTSSTYRIHPLPISGDKVVPSSGKSGDKVVRLQVAPMSPIQSPTETVSGADDSVRRPRHVVPLPAPGMPAPKCSAPERKSPEEFVRELLRAAGGTLPVATINGAADKPGGPGFRAIENLMIRHPRFKYSIDPKTNKGLLTLIEDQPQ